MYSYRSIRQSVFEEYTGRKFSSLGREYRHVDFSVNKVYACFLFGDSSRRLTSLGCYGSDIVAPVQAVKVLPSTTVQSS